MPVRSFAAVVTTLALFSIAFLDRFAAQAAPNRPAIAPDPAPSATVAPYDALAWRNVGPAVAGGRLAAIAGSDLDPSLVYIGAAGGGVWKSTNGTTSWTPVFDKQDVGAIGAVAISPRDPNDVWVGTGESNPRNDVSYGDGMYRTRDGGATWTHLGLPGSYAISKISLDPRDPNVAVVAALGDPFRDSDERGVYRTTDGGTTWTQTLSLGPDSGAADLTRGERSPNVLFASMWQFRRSSWHLTSGGTRDGLYKSTDGGAHFARVIGNGFAPGITGRIGVAIAPSDPKRVYALVESSAGLLWRSDDGGTHWHASSTNTLIDERPFYYTRVFVDPHDENHLFATSVRLAESKDGGATWQLSGKHTHGDHHDVWFSHDGRTVLEANDGGPTISRDNGATFEWRNNVPIAQAYRVAVDARAPYWLCMGLQDNGAWCGPSDDRSDAGILPIDWLRVGGGDGNWTVPDPTDPQIVWSSFGGGDNGGSLSRYDERTRTALDVSPYLRNQNVVPPSELRYRFNWEAPLAFSPFDGRVAYYGGNALFRTTDRGTSWTVVSPDLTRNVKARQVLSGTPLRLDVTGAETFDTMLDVVPSAAARREIWISTDDGRVQLTRDDGARWRDVTMPGMDADARIPTLAASAHDPATAYAVVDRHFTGDRSPYAYATHDYGTTWHAIVADLPRDQFARAIAEDPRAPNVLFLGLENSVWWSDDFGTTWRSLQQNLPAVSVRDLRVQTTTGDLVAATHGRGTWILDDIAPLERAAAARARAATLFPPRVAHQYTSDTPTANPSAAGAGPPGPGLITYYLARPAKTPPRVEILDAHGIVVRDLTARDDASGDDDKPPATDVTGFDRIAWDLSGTPPVPWYRAPKWNRGPSTGADLMPGTYTVRLTVDGTSQTQPLVVAADPRLPRTPAERATHVAYVTRLVDEISRIDRALNEIDNLDLQVPVRLATLHAGASTVALASRAHATLAEADATAATLSSHPINGQDNDFLRDLLRERVQSLLGIATMQSPTVEQSRESIALAGEVDRVLARHAAFVREHVMPLLAALHASGAAPLDLAARPESAKPGGPPQDEHGDRREDQ